MTRALLLATTFAASASLAAAQTDAPPPRLSPDAMTDICAIIPFCTTSPEILKATGDTPILLPKWGPEAMRKMVRQQASPEATKGYGQGLADAAMVDICQIRNCCLDGAKSVAAMTETLSKPDVAKDFILLEPK